MQVEDKHYLSLPKPKPEPSSKCLESHENKNRATKFMYMLREICILGKILTRYFGSRFSKKDY